MSKFTSPLKVEVDKSGRIYTLLEEIEYYRSENKNEVLVVPKGFKSDFATTPRIVWSLFPPFGSYAKSAVLHDFLCEKFHAGLCSRKFADLIFLESMKAVGVNKITRNVLYFSVRFYAGLKGFK